MNESTASLIRVLVVDDEPPARHRMRDLLTGLASELPLQIVGEAASAPIALDLIAAIEVDVLLLDVQMPAMNGLELARRLREMTRPPVIIFITAHEEHALAAFDVSATDYLLKPVRSIRLREALLRARSRLTGAQRGPFEPSATAPAESTGPAPVPAALRPVARQHFTVTERDRVILVPVLEVIYLQADTKYLRLRTRDHEYLLAESLVQIEQEFGNFFVRIHRGCIVARWAIKALERTRPEANENAGWSVVIDGTDERLAVSRRQWPTLRQMLAS